ncbi:unnamed protein product [Acanthosepion pharaonis]|uniref:Uncharacterized protein n=1 Tax=Acanthosepion pharaonis TaxID=158019 RepID=A0A812CEY9_ACAPH|nr:unnamed protein product [Sepia pharaonis]
MSFKCLMASPSLPPPASPLSEDTPEKPFSSLMNPLHYHLRLLSYPPTSLKAFLLHPPIFPRLATLANPSRTSLNEALLIILSGLPPQEKKKKKKMPPHCILLSKRNFLPPSLASSGKFEPPDHRKKTARRKVSPFSLAPSPALLSATLSCPPASLLSFTILPPLLYDYPPLSLFFFSLSLLYRFLPQSLFFPQPAFSASLSCPPSLSSLPQPQPQFLLRLSCPPPTLLISVSYPCLLLHISSFLFAFYYIFHLFFLPFTFYHYFFLFSFPVSSSYNLFLPLSITSIFIVYLFGHLFSVIFFKSFIFSLHIFIFYFSH